MLKVFNKNALTRKQRFSKAILFGCLATLLAVVLNLILIKVFYVYFSILYLAIGLGIGYCIQYFGRGVQIQFSLLAAGLTLLTIIICDLTAFNFDVRSILTSLTSYGLDSLIDLAYRIVGIYLAFRYARVV
ncbi:MAG: hypothetical protein Q4C64_06255 [Erysipelotrichia bacterium]|nr:hypothetical protein [Erysipelotrichia bacterium]